MAANLLRAYVLFACMLVLLLLQQYSTSCIAASAKATTAGAAPSKAAAKGDKSKGGKTVAGSISGGGGRKYKGPLLPRLPPHEDTSYLLSFHSDGNDLCSQMEPVVRRLEEDLSTKVRRINIFARKEFVTLLESVGHDECGQVPFYYNRRTGQAVCGATSYLNLKRWGTGNLKHLFQDPPENLYDLDSAAHVKRGEVGFKGFFNEKIRALEKSSPDGDVGKKSVGKEGRSKGKTVSSKK